MPVNEFPGALRLGLRRRRPLRALPPLRRARRPARLRRRGPRLGHRRDPGRRLQPPRPGRQVPGALRRRPTTRERYLTEWGKALNFDGEGSGPVREWVVAQRPLLGRGVPPRRLPHRRHPEHLRLRRGPRAHPGRDRPRAPARPPGRAGSTSWARTSRRTHGWSGPRPEGGLRARRAVERRFPPQRPGGADRPQRGLLHRLSRQPAGVRLGGQARLPLPGPALPLAGAAARHARPRSRAGAVRHLPPEPRPARQLRPRPAAAPDRRRRAATGR